MNKDIKKDIDFIANNAKKYFPLSKKEEIKLFYQWKNGDEKAYEKLVCANLKFVIKTAHKFSGYIDENINFSDLIQAGNEGLMRAISKYDPKKNLKIITYATHWIQAMIRNYVQDNSYTVKRFTGHYDRKLFSYQSVVRDITETKNDADKIAKRIKLSIRTGVPEKYIEAIEKSIVNDREISSNQYLSEESDTTIQDEIVSDTNEEETILNKNSNNKTINCLYECINNLPKEDAEIIQKRMSGETLDNVAKSLYNTHTGKKGISRERVRQREIKIKDKLKKNLMKKQEIIEEFCL